jgi:hypothetical protein
LAGVIGVGGLILCKIPLETVRERTAHYQGVTADRMDSVDNDLLKESNPLMPIHKPDRRSKVTFGSSE